MKMKLIPALCLFCILDISSVFAQYTPKYIMGTAEYDCYIIPTATHHVYDVSAGQPALVANQPSVVTQVAGALHHSCVLDNAGNCYCWGDNANGEIGNGTTSATLVPAMYHIATDSAGNPFTNIVQVMPGGNSFGYETSALKTDGTVWIWGNTSGGNRGNGQNGGTNTRPVQVNFPAGTVIKKIQIDIVCMALDANGNVWTWGGNDGYLAPYVLSQGTLTPNPTVPHKVSLPTPAKDISGGSLWNYALLTNGSLYGWAYYSAYLGIGSSGFVSEAAALLAPQLLDGQLGLPHPIASISASSAATYAILTDSTLWAWGDNAVGAIGNGKELDFSKYTTNPSPSGGTLNPYNWDWGPGELMQQKPVHIAVGLHSFTNIWTSGSDVFYCYAEDVNGQLYSWGRGKGAVLGNGIAGAGSGAIASSYPNSWDVPWVTAVNPFALTAPIPTTSPYCVVNPSKSPCNGYPIPVTAAPTVSAGANQNIATSSATLSGSAAPHSASIMSYLWTQLSGPGTALITLNTGPLAQVTGLVTGTYVFQLEATDNNWRSGTSSVTIVVGSVQAPKPSLTINAGSPQTITLPVSSISLAGTASGNNGASISSTTWTETGGPNTGAIASASALSTAVTGLIAGTYSFKLTAIGSGGLDTSATVTTTVNAAAASSPPIGAYQSIPGIVQAENYSSMSGVQTEPTKDAGGGLDVGWIDPGDWMDYNVNPSAAGTYTVSFRVATPLSGGILRLKIANGNVLADVKVPNTGNYEFWQTVTASVTLAAGDQTLQILNEGATGWNINWMDIEKSKTTQDAIASTQTDTAQKFAATPSADTVAAPQPDAASPDPKLSEALAPALTLYPNPAHDNFTLNINNGYTGKMTVQVIAQSGQLVRTFESVKESSGASTTVNIGDLTPGMYFIHIRIGAWTETKKLVKL
jgi:alpha-tubulin suppressor-like RCC1 family protein